MTKRTPEGHYVYCWTNLVNGKQYVGKGFGRRMWSHCKQSATGALAQAMRKYGLRAFRAQVLAEGLTEPDAFDRERWAIYALDTKGWGYNKTDGGEVGPSGRVMPPEERRRRGDISRGRRHTPETLHRMSEARKGRKLSEQTCARIGEAQRGKPKPAGRKVSDEGRASMSIAHGVPVGAREEALRLLALGGMTQRAIAAIVGVNESSVSNWKLGKTLKGVK